MSVYWPWIAEGPGLQHGWDFWASMNSSDVLAGHCPPRPHAREPSGLDRLGELGAGFH